MNTVELALAAIAAYVQLHGLAPDEARETLPTPIVRNGHQEVVIGYHLGQAIKVGAGEPRKIQFPYLQVMAQIPRHTITTREISPKDFGLSFGRTEYVGDLGDLRRFDLRTYKAKKKHYVELLSVVIDRGWLLDGAAVDGEQAQVAKELSAAFLEVREKALVPYYSVAAAPLISWFRKAGAPTGE
jgi:hypothetical protein